MNSVGCHLKSDFHILRGKPVAYSNEASVFLTRNTVDFLPKRAKCLFLCKCYNIDSLFCLSESVSTAGGGRNNIAVI